MLPAHDLIALSTGISSKREKVPDPFNAGKEGTFGGLVMYWVNSSSFTHIDKKFTRP